MDDWDYLAMEADEHDKTEERRTRYLDHAQKCFYKEHKDEFNYDSNFFAKNPRMLKDAISSRMDFLDEKRRKKQNMDELKSEALFLFATLALVTAVYFIGYFSC